ncbi:MAG: transposase for insertion sequence element ISApl1 [Parcubacteria group bacterium Gr01-1014_33]|nr:MAG: transposase for insertion sequence element ISApl1 [Parcubacteria group bacterium Gr01-1014_33]
MYHHIKRDDRVALAILLRQGYSQAAAARAMGKHPSSLSRELTRNTREKGSYHARSATMYARERRKNAKVAYRKIENDAVLAARIETRLHPLVSPEVIAHDTWVSYETIYGWIHRSRPDLKALLPQRGKKRRRYGSKREAKQGWTRDVRSIEARPVGAMRRSRVGHFEGDTIRGRNGALLTLTDRKSRFEVAVRVPNGGCDPVYAALTERRENLHARSFTFDRGSEFSLWRMIERGTDTRVYFAHPRAPWQRGTNENSNQRLRRVFPKRFDFATIIQRDVDAVVWLMNHTKRKCLNWRTPCRMFRRCCASS